MTKCGIIRDLFTAYVSGVGSEDTRALVEEHIETCDDCKSKLAEVQNRVAAQLRENDATNINVFKTMKKRIFQRNVLVAAIASVLVFAVAVGGFWFVFHNDKPIEYANSNIRTERNTAEMYIDVDGTTTTATVLDIVSSKDYYASYATSRVINVDGTETEIVYFYLSETLSTKWWPKNSGEHILRLVATGKYMSGGMDIINYPSLPIEIYYFVMPPLDKVGFMNDDDFYAQRTNGVLLWSGTLE